MLATKNIKLQGPQKLQDHYTGPFTVLEYIGETAYLLDLAASKRQALQGLHDIFHINLLRRYQSNRLDYKAPPIEIDDEE